MTLTDTKLSVAEQRAALENIELWGNTRVCEYLGVLTPNLDKVADLPAPALVTPTGRLWLADEIKALKRSRSRARRRKAK